MLLVSITARARWELTLSSCPTTPRPFPQSCSPAGPSLVSLSGVNPSHLQHLALVLAELRKDPFSVFLKPGVPFAFLQSLGPPLISRTFQG